MCLPRDRNRADAADVLVVDLHLAVRSVGPAPEFYPGVAAVRD
jgi:hypothetical protein